MNAYQLVIKSQDLAWAKSEATRTGCRLIPDEEPGIYMLIGPRLSATLAGFEKKDTGGHDGAGSYGEPVQSEGDSKSRTASRSVALTSTVDGQRGDGTRMRPDAVNRGVSGRESSADSTTFHALDIPFEARSYASKLGARWDDKLKCSFFKGTLPAALKPMKAAPYSWEMALQNAKNNIPPEPFGPEGEPFVPRPHQSEAGKAIFGAYESKFPGFLLADEVGLGKTISAWLGAQRIARSMQANSILIVCPLSVVPHWRETISRMGSFAPNVLILNYDRLGKLLEMPEGVKAKSKKGLAKRGAAPQIDVVIFDEAHKLKNPTTARSKFAAKITAAANFCLYLSATAGQSPLELSYLAELIAKATGQRVKDLKDFEQWCIGQGFGVSKGSFGQWKWTGETSDCIRLREILYEGQNPVGLRRRPQQIAGWPEISRQLLPQPLDAAQKGMYQTQWEQFKKAIEEFKEDRITGAHGGTAKAGSLRAGTATKSVTKASAKGESQEEKKKSSSLSQLVEALRFRQKSSELRIEQTVQFALDLWDEGIKPAISCVFRDSANALKEKLEKAGLDVSLIAGGMGLEEREQQRLDFQHGRTQAVIFTVEEGISLHEGQYLKDDLPRALLIHDLRWSAIQMSQIEGRCHRDGKFARAYWLAGEDTVEFKIAKRVAKRAEAMKVLSGDGDSNIEKEILEALDQWSLEQEVA